jgi:DNA-binding CsgD family transcriptional regulator
VALEQLGLIPEAEVVYRMMLQNPGLDVEGLSALLGWTVDKTTSAIDDLARLALIRPSAAQPGRFRTIHPEFGLNMLLIREQMTLREHERRVDDTKRAVLTLIEQMGDLGADVSEQRLLQLHDLDGIQWQMEKLAHACTEEVAVFATGGAQPPESLAAARPLDADVLARGVQVRNLYLDAARNDPPTAEYARWLVAQGGQVRTTPHLPLRMVIYDRRYAVLPIDPEAADAGAVVLGSSGVVAALQTFFEQTWRRATPLAEEPSPDENGLSERERVLLTLLAEGHTDETVANKLGISVRTGRRITAELLKRLGARSRFQAGALATTKGWLDTASL